MSEQTNKQGKKAIQNNRQVIKQGSKHFAFKLFCPD